VVKPIALAVKENASADAEVYAYAFREPSLFFYSGWTFPIIRGVPLETLLCKTEPVYVVTKESSREAAARPAPYVVVARRDGFAENGGEMTLVLLRNNPERCGGLEPATPRGQDVSKSERR
jgi:hypothetical protein